MATARGFTLVELLIVIGVLGVLAGITYTVINVPFQQGKARDAQRKQDLRQIQTALEIYYNDNGSYPTTEWVNSINGGTWIPGLGTQYLATMPKDPKNSGCGAGQDPRVSTTCFIYAYYSGFWCNINGQGYILATRLESYSNSDLSQKFILSPSGGCTWSESPVNGLYVVAP